MTQILNVKYSSRRRRGMNRRFRQLHFLWLGVTAAVTDKVPNNEYTIYQVSYTSSHRSHYTANDQQSNRPIHETKPAQKYFTSVVQIGFVGTQLSLVIIRDVYIPQQPAAK